MGGGLSDVTYWQPDVLFAGHTLAILSLDLVIPFGDDIGLRVGSPTELHALARNIVQQNLQRVEECTTDNLVFLNNLLQIAVDERLGPATARAFQRWRVEVLFPAAPPDFWGWYELAWVGWSAAMRTGRAEPLNFRDAQLLLSAFTESRDLSGTRNKIAHAISASLTTWDRFIFERMKYALTPRGVAGGLEIQPVADDEFTDPFESILRAAQRDRFQQFWDVALGHLSAPELDRLHNAAQRDRQSVVPSPTQLVRIDWKDLETG